MKKTIFLSYCQAESDASYVNEIDEAFGEIDIELIRDNREVSYKDSFKEFMKGIRTTDAVIMVISESYFRSRNCMYEVLEVYKDENFKERIQPIVLPETKVYSEEDIVDKCIYWDKKHSDLNARIKKVPTEAIGNLGEDLRVYSSIRNNVAEFCSLIRDLYVPPYEKLKEKGFKDIINKLPFEASYDLDINSVFTINSKAHILDQTYEAISKLHKEVGFYPLHLLVNQYPFKTRGKGNSYYYLGTLYTNNEELVSLIQKVTEDVITDQKILSLPDYQNKIAFILKSLKLNKIFCVSHHNISHKKIKVISPDLIDEDIKFLCDTYRYIDCFEKIQINSSNIKKLLKYAFVSYRLFEFTLSAKYLLKAYNLSIESDLKISAFIALYNLLKLEDSFLYANDDNTIRIRNDIKETGGNSKLNELESSETKDYITWIKKGLFYHHSNEKINDALIKITEHYYLQLKGGISQNSNIESLILAFDEFIEFLNSTYIFFEHFHNFNKLISRYTEGVLACHAITEKGGSRLKYINDDQLAFIIRYAETDDIRKYFNRYRLSQISYRSVKNSKLNIKKAINNFFESFKLFSTKGGSEKALFKSNYIRILCNIVTVVSITSFENSYKNIISEKLIYLLEEEDFLEGHDLKHIGIFFSTVASSVDSSYLHKLVSIYLSNEKKYLNYFLLDSIILSFKNIKTEVELGESEFSQLKILFRKHYFDNKQLGSLKPERLIDFISIIRNEEYKNYFGGKIEEAMSCKFHFELYYRATINGIIKHNQKDLYELAKKYIISVEFRKVNAPFLGVNAERNHTLDSFINLNFAFDKKLQESDFEKISSFSAYYEWLLNLDEFNYDKFDAIWITEYATCFYYKKFYNSKKLKNELEKMLTNNIPSSVKKAYLDIYISKIWEKAWNKWVKDNTLPAEKKV